MPAVILDTDIGTDVDDALALSVLLGSPEVELLGVTTVYGDTVLRARLVSRLARLATSERTGRGGRGEQLPVFAGLSRTTTGRDVYWAGHEGATIPDLHTEPVRNAGDERAAIAFLVDTVRSRPGEVAVLAVGPLTNIAAAIEADAGFAGDLGGMYVMGGAFAAVGAPAPAAEHNIACDPEAAAVVFGSEAAITVVGLDVTTRTRVRAAELARIDAAGALGAELGRQVRQFWQASNADGNTPHDPLVAVRLLRPDLFTGVDADVNVLIEPGRPGATLLTPPTRHTQVATDVHVPEAVEQIVARIEAAGR
jgi:purine nucleosidase